MASQPDDTAVMTILPDYQRRAIAGAKHMFSGRTSTLSYIQNRSLADAEADPPPWACKATLPVPLDATNTILDAVVNAIDKLGSGVESYAKPPVESVDVTWTFPRGNAWIHESPTKASISEPKDFDSIAQYITNDVTILYIHGGGF